MDNTARIADLPVDQRPRERLFAVGPESLLDGELVALVLGPPNASALARDLLSRFGGVGGLLDRDAQSLLAVRGLGDAKVAALVAVRELLKRAELTRMKKAPILSSTKTVRRYLGLHLAGLDREVFGALLLDTRHRFIAVENIFLGSIDRTMVYPREVVKCCLRHNAAAVVLFHNHPSGDTDPSPCDVELTNRLRAVLDEVDVRLVDHMVAARMRLVSMAERGLM